MGLFGPSPQEKFNELCASTLTRIFGSSVEDSMKERLANQFLDIAKAAADDKSCDVLRETNKASADALQMVRYFEEIEARKRH
jgi:hypothetical protein